MGHRYISLIYVCTCSLISFLCLTLCNYLNIYVIILYWFMYTIHIRVSIFSRKSIFVSSKYFRFRPIFDENSTKITEYFRNFWGLENRKYLKYFRYFQYFRNFRVSKSRKSKIIFSVFSIFSKFSNFEISKMEKLFIFSKFSKFFISTYNNFHGEERIFVAIEQLFFGKLWHRVRLWPHKLQLTLTVYIRYVLHFYESTVQGW